MPKNKIAGRVLPKCQFALSVAPAFPRFIIINQFIM